MSIDVTLYKRPNGASEIVSVANIRDEDAEWFKANNANLSMEDIGGRSAEDTFSALRKQCEEMLLAA